MVAISYLFSSLFLLSTGCASLRYITTSPENVAVPSGNSTYFDCATNSSSGVNWDVTTIGQPQAAVVRICQLNPSYIGIYDITQGSTGTCNIVVLSARIYLAGAYTCQDSTGFDPPQTAQLVVLDSDPVCTVQFNDGNTTDVAEYELIQLACTAFYTTNLSPLDTVWTDPIEHEVIANTETTPDGNYKSYIEFTAPSELVEAYSAFTYFLSPLNSSFEATNTPSYTFSWTFPVIDVLYCPNNITVLDNGEPLDESAVSVGDNLTCYSNGQPDPLYVWIDLLTGQQTEEGQSLIVPNTGHFKFLCRAFNSFRGDECNISTEVSGDAAAMKVYPQNIAAIVGTNASMECSYGFEPLNWIFTATGLPGVVIVLYCKVVSSVTGFYDVDTSTGGCNLIFLDVAVSNAGVYTCQASDSPVKPPTAQLIVLDSNPVCSDDVQPDGIVVSGDKVRISCSMNYAGYTGYVGSLIPTISFFNSIDDQQITNATNASTVGQALFYIDMTVYPEIFPSFTARTFFPVPVIPDSPTSIPARNAPLFAYSWNSTQRIVYSSGSILVQQNNQDDSNSYVFNVSWNEYVNGFGSAVLNSTYWIGLERLHLLTNAGSNCIAQFDLLPIGTNTWYWTAEYSEFVVDSSATDYTLHVGGYSGNLYDAMAYHNGRTFVTYDHNDLYSCAANYGAGFWFDACCEACINLSQNYFNWYGVNLQMSRFWVIC